MRRASRILAIAPIIILAAALTACPPTVTVPAVSGQTQADAATALAAAQLVIGTLSSGFSASVPRDSVISQKPSAGSRVSPNSSVDLVISLGPEPKLGWVYTSPTASVWGLTIDNTSDSGFIIAGGHNSNKDMYALKLDASGAMVWDHAYSNMSTGTTPAELWPKEARGIRQTADGGYIMLGAGHNEGDKLPEMSFLLVKTDSTGGVVWSKAYCPDNPYKPGYFSSITIPFTLQVTRDGGYVASGSSFAVYDTAHKKGYYLASILKTDADGKVQFVKIINDNAHDYNQIILAGQQTQDDGYVLTGYSNAGSSAGSLALLIKLDSAGELQWSKTFQDTTESYGAQAYALTQTEDGGYVIGGELVGPIGKAVDTHGCWLGKFDANGDNVWFRYVGDAASIHYPNTFKETPEHDLLATGFLSDGKMGLTKFTSDGYLLWNYRFTDMAGMAGNDLALVPDGSCVVVGSSTNTTTVVAQLTNVFQP